MVPERGLEADDGGPALVSDLYQVTRWIREQYPDTFVNVINSSDVVGNFYIQPLE